MKIAIPLHDGVLCAHFGHCQHFGVYAVDPEAKEPGEGELLDPPPHEPGVLPRWLASQGVNRIIAGGMGMRAQQLFRQFGIEVVVGAPAGLAPREILRDHLAGQLQAGANLCDH